MSKLTKLLSTLDDLVEQCQKKFDRAMAAEATAIDEYEKRTNKETLMWAEIEYRDAQRMRQFILDAINN